MLVELGLPKYQEMTSDRLSRLKLQLGSKKCSRLPAVVKYWENGCVGNCSPAKAERK